ncbi:unnamed protein product [Ilex paraguariensis]|uniref:Uncharacterized protein n=1 Tax=Ilex paraguariensis TaxID=185542 RepID=A0ABC8QSY3_9AQUA
MDHSRLPVPLLMLPEGIFCWRMHCNTTIDITGESRKKQKNQNRNPLPLFFYTFSLTNSITTTSGSRHLLVATNVLAFGAAVDVALGDICWRTHYILLQTVKPVSEPILL